MAMIKVQATRLGYYGNRRRKEGMVFHVEEKHFSSNWMKRLDEAPVSKKKAAAAKEPPAKEPEAPVIESSDDSVI
jgi:hypothetical protein